MKKRNKKTTKGGLVTSRVEEEKEQLVKESVTSEVISLPSLTPIQRVKIMNDFASAAMDEDLKSKILNRPNGKEIYDVFVLALNNKISAIMDNDSSKYQIFSAVTEKAIEANKAIDDINDNLSSLVNFLKALSGSVSANKSPERQPHRDQESTQNASDPRSRAEEVRRAQQAYMQKNSLINGI